MGGLGLPDRPALLGTQGSGLVLARARAALALVLALPDRPALLGTKGVWPCPGPRAGGALVLALPDRPALLGTQGSGLVLARARAALALVWALPDRPALLGTQGGLALSWPARGRPWPFGPSRSTGPVGRSRVWPCPGPRAGGLGLGLGHSRSTGPVGHSRVWPCPGPRAGGLGFGPSRSTGPVGHSRVWPCPGPRAGGLGLGFGPSRSTGPVGGQSRVSGLVLARAREALALALPDRPALLGTQGSGLCPGPRARAGLGFFKVFQGFSEFFSVFYGFSMFFRVFQGF